MVLEMEMEDGVQAYSSQEGKLPPEILLQLHPTRLSMQKVRELGSRTRRKTRPREKLLFVVMVADANLLEPVTPNRAWEWEKTLYLWRSSARNHQWCCLAGVSIAISRFQISPKSQDKRSAVALAFVKKK
jgi:hypothetical protein